MGRAQRQRRRLAGGDAATRGRAAASAGLPSERRRGRHLAGGSDVAAHLGAVSRPVRIDRNANFFELGGDSLIAISVAMTAGQRGLDLTPQDLYENQTVASLAKVLIARYAAGGWPVSRPDDAMNPPVPPNVTYFLEHGLRDVGRWRTPVILQSALRHRRKRRPGGTHRAVTVSTTRCGVHLVERAGSWDQHIADAASSPSCSPGSSRRSGDGSPQERTAVFRRSSTSRSREHQVVRAVDCHVHPRRVRRSVAISH